MESTERPDHASIAASSAFVKLLCGQWKLLHVVDGVLYWRFGYTDGRPDVLQLLVPFAMRNDFLVKMTELLFARQATINCGSGDQERSVTFIV